MPPTLSLNNHYSRRSYCWNPLVCASGAKQYYNLLPSYYLCKGRDERGIHIVIESTVSVSLMERLDLFRMSLGGWRVGLEQGGWTVLMLLVLLVVRFGRGRHCVRLVSFFRILCVSLFRGRKDSETYLSASKSAFPFSHHENVCALGRQSHITLKRSAPPKANFFQVNLLVPSAPLSPLRLLVSCSCCARETGCREVS